MDLAKSSSCYKKIIVRGVVQGVGFRPFVQRLADSHKICGTVQNQGGSVCIFACGDIADVDAFIGVIRENPPQGAWIANIETEDAPNFAASDFSIIKSDATFSQSSDFVSPDIGICEECLKEIRDKKNRRYAHPFNSCVACGPRYSVLESLPYDRENTTMSDFPLCESCQNEYNSHNDRRFHAQTVCCNECGPTLRLCLKSSDEYIGFEAVAHAIDALNAGKILAIKGIGGYHFACSPHNNTAARELRALKGRDKKPFAVMFRDLEAIRKLCLASETEEKLLTSSARPITLLSLEHREFAEDVLCGDNYCGCFLPYTALHHLLLDELEALVLTSANISGSSIISDDELMKEFLQKSGSCLFAGILCHDRKIRRVVEDSVVQAMAGQVQILRRARGYAPAALPIKNISGCDFLAIGGDLKATFCLVKGDFAYLSPYFGDLEDVSVYNNFKAAIQEYMTLFNVNPSFILCDMHPAYFSANLAEELGLPLVRIQHHHAHIASVMAEHSLEEKVIGVAFDGTGYGDDGTVWGGEFLICEGESYRRVGQLAYTKLVGGDSSAKDAQKTALCYLLQSGEQNLHQFDDRVSLIEAAIRSDINTSLSSSFGRLFDAVAAILGICFENTYEGESAILLQRCAENARKLGTKPYKLSFEISEKDGYLTVDGCKMAADIYSLAAVEDSGALALGFHFAVAKLIKDMCIRIREREKVDVVALSGGVFQNKMLLELATEYLEKADFKVYTNRTTTPNDGAIALGQAYLGGKKHVHSHSCKNY